MIVENSSSNWQSILYLNEQLFKLSKKDIDIIIVASQANSIPHNCNNLMDYPIKQNIFLMATQPDAIILCINQYDEISYIKNTIQGLQGFAASKVIALVMFPVKNSLENENKFSVKELMTEKDFNIYAEKLTSELKIPVFLLGERTHMLHLCKNIIDFF